MITKNNSIVGVCSLILLFAAGQTAVGKDKSKASASKIKAEAGTALKSLYASNEQAKELGKRAKGVLVFPEIVKGGFIAGGSFGHGALFQNGKVTAYYNSVAASYGLQAGIQKYGYALFIMDDGAIKAMNQSDGWNIGSAPSLVVVDKGVAKSLSTTTIQKGTYAFFFNQKGLMGGLGLEGSKISRIHPEDE